MPRKNKHDNNKKHDNNNHPAVTDSLYSLLLDLKYSQTKDKELALINTFIQNPTQYFTNTTKNPSIDTKFMPRSANTSFVEYTHRCYNVLYCLMEWNKLHAAKVLIEKGASLDSPYQSSVGAHEAAMRTGNYAFTKYVMNKCSVSTLKRKGKDGCAPAIFTAISMDLDNPDLPIEAFTQSKDDDTQDSMVKLLLSHPSIPINLDTIRSGKNTPNAYFGHTPLSYAKAYPVNPEKGKAIANYIETKSNLNQVKSTPSKKRKNSASSHLTTPLKKRRVEKSTTEKNAMEENINEQAIGPSCAFSMNWDKEIYSEKIQSKDYPFFGVQNLFTLFKIDVSASKINELHLMTQSQPHKNKLD